MGYYVVTVAGGINGGTNFHDARGERTAGIFDEREFDGGAWRGAAARRFRDLKLDLERGELADAKTFVAFGNRLAFAEVAADDDASEGSVDAGLFFFQFEAIDFGVAAFDQGFITVEIVLGGFGFEFGGFEVGVAGETEGAQLLLASVGGAFSFEFGFLIFFVVFLDLKIGIGFDDFHLQTAIVELGEQVARFHGGAFVLIH